MLTCTVQIPNTSERQTGQGHMLCSAGTEAGSSIASNLGSGDQSQALSPGSAIC